MNLMKRVMFRLTATAVAKSNNSKLRDEYGLIVIADFTNNSITILRVGKKLIELLPLRVSCPDKKGFFNILEKTEEKIVIVPKNECKRLAQEIWVLEDVIEYILKQDDGFSVLGVEFIPAEEKPYKPIKIQ